MAARVSLTSIELRAAKDCWRAAFPMKLRDPQSGDLINDSFPAALVTSEENTPATPTQMWGSALLCEDDNHDYIKETRVGKQKQPLALPIRLAP